MRVWGSVCVVGLMLWAAGVAGAGQVDLSTPQSATRVFLEAMAANDPAAAAVAVVFSEDPKRAAVERQLLEAEAVAISGFGKLSEAAVAKFGEAGKRLELGAVQQVLSQLDKAEVKIDGDTARLTPRRDQDPVVLKKSGGVWKMDLGAALGDNEEASRTIPEIRRMGQAAAEVAAETEQGKFKTIDEMKAALRDTMEASARATTQAASTTVPVK